MLDTPPAPVERDTTTFGLPKNIGPGERVIRAVVGVGRAGVGAYGVAIDDLSALPRATASLDTAHCIT